MTYTIKIKVLGKWFIASRGVSAIEAERIRFMHASDPTVQVVTE